VILALEDDTRVLRDQFAGFIDAARFDKNLARHDQGLGAGEALDQTAIQKQTIGAHPARLTRGDQ
jgi:hypothetical protein